MKIADFFIKPDIIVGVGPVMYAGTNGTVEIYFMLYCNCCEPIKILGGIFYADRVSDVQPNYDQIVSVVTKERNIVVKLIAAKTKKK